MANGTVFKWYPSTRLLTIWITDTRVNFMVKMCSFRQNFGKCLENWTPCIQYTNGICKPDELSYQYSGIQIVQVMWLYHLNTGHPYCLVFRYSVFRWLLYSTITNFFQHSNLNVSLCISLRNIYKTHLSFRQVTNKQLLPKEMT